MALIRKCFNDVRFILTQDLLLFVFFMLVADGFQRFFHTMMGEAQLHASLMVPAVVGKIFAGLLESVFLLLLVPLRILDSDLHRPKSSFMDFMIVTTKPLTIESLRAFAITLLWLPALILPAVFKMIRYMFVPFVVLADPRYDKGEIDALDESNRLVKGITFPLFLLQLLPIGIEYSRSAFKDQFDIIAAPHIVLPGIALFSLLNLFFSVLLFRIYQLRKRTLDAVS